MNNVDTIELSKKKTDVIPFIAEVVCELKLYDNVNIVSITDTEELLIDRKLFKQVMHTVIKNVENSIDRNNEGRIDISIDRIGESLLFCIENNGPPVPKNKLTNQKELSQTIGANEGTGLNDCRKIIKAHGGKIWFSSKPGKETDVYIRIPV